MYRFTSQSVVEHQHLLKICQKQNYLKTVESESVCVCVCVRVVLGIKPRTLCMPGLCPATEPHPQPEFQTESLETEFKMELQAGDLLRSILRAFTFGEIKKRVLGQSLEMEKKSNCSMIKTKEFESWDSPSEFSHITHITPVAPWKRPKQIPEVKSRISPADGDGFVCRGERIWTRFTV